MLLRSKAFIIPILILGLVILSNVDLIAQCPMCRVSAETNLENGGTEAKGLNTGILYLLAIPYLIIFILGYTWWNNNRKQKSLED